MTVGDRIREFAKSRFRTQAAFGVAVGMTESAVSDLVKNRQAPSTGTLQRFADVGMNLNWLLTGSGQMGIAPPTDATEDPGAAFRVDDETAMLLATAIENPRAAPLDHLRLLRQLNDAQRQIIDDLASLLPESR